jgi:hypothetical protein
VVEEIKAAGGEAIGVAGDVGADDFPKKIVDATVQYVNVTSNFNSIRICMFPGNTGKSITSSTMVCPWRLSTMSHVLNIQQPGSRLTRCYTLLQTIHGT